MRSRGSTPAGPHKHLVDAGERSTLSPGWSIPSCLGESRCASRAVAGDNRDAAETDKAPVEDFR